MVKSRKNIKKQREFTAKTSKSKNIFDKTRGGGNCSKLRIEPGGFHEPEEPVAMKIGVNHMA